MNTQHICLMGIVLFCICSLAGCSSSTGDSRVDETPPPVPSDLTITEIGNGSVSMSWKAVYDNGLKGYNVYWLGEAEMDTLNANLRFVTTNYLTISGLDYNTLYSFAVSSVDKSGNESALSVQERGKPLNTTSPQPPEGVDLVAENIEYPKVTVYWAENMEPDLAYYNVYRALSPAGFSDSASYVTSLTHENYIDIDVEIGVKYYYQITAVDKEGWESKPSVTISDYILPKVTLISPLNFEYVSLSPTFIWEAVTGAKQYNVVITTTRIGGEIYNITVDETTTQVIYQGKTRLISGNTYYWKVGAISLSEINSTSDTASFVVRAQ